MNAHLKEFDEDSEVSRTPHVLKNREDHALVIGVNDYPKGRSLRGAIADAQAFAAWLVDEAGGNVPKKNVFTFLSTPDPVAPMDHEINDALESIFTQAEATGGRRFYLYFSGHGCVGDRASDLALCLANWSEVRRRAALASEAWLDVVVRSGLFEEVAFFLDCCRVWATRAVGLPPQIDDVKPVMREQPTRVFLAYATEFQRTAGEWAENAPESRGIFTQVLLEGLQRNACDERGNITAISLKQHLEKYTYDRARALGFHQRAEVLNGLDEQTQFGPSRPIPHAALPATDPARSARLAALCEEIRRLQNQAHANDFPQTLHGQPIHSANDALTEWEMLSEFAAQFPAHCTGSTFRLRHSILDIWKSVIEQRRHFYRDEASLARFATTTHRGLDQTNASSRLLIVMLTPATKDRLPMKGGWSLQCGEEVKELVGSNSSDQSEQNHFVFSARMNPGPYILRHVSGREVGVYLYPGWTTQVLMEETGGPHFERLLMFLCPRGREEHLPPRTAHEIVLGLQLLNMATGTPPSSIHQLIHGPPANFNDPMIGLLAAHLYTRQKSAAPERIEAFAKRLEELLGPCPDIDALRLRAALLQGKTIPKIAATHPPMLRQGLVTFVEASHLLPDVIAPASLLEHACAERLVDSPFSSWPVRPANPPHNDWLTTIIQDLANENDGDTSTLDTHTIARVLGVPLRTITTRIETTRVRTAAKKILATVPIESLEPVTANAPKMTG